LASADGLGAAVTQGGRKKMPDDITAQRYTAHYSKPFIPFSGSPGGPDSSGTLRIAEALEYIAAQLGKMNEREERRERAPLKVAEDLAQHLTGKRGTAGDSPEKRAVIVSHNGRFAIESMTATHAQSCSWTKFGPENVVPRL
jgi:hypothetical protein